MAQTVTAKQTVQNMTEGSPVSLILRFALPIFISQVFQQLYSTADAFIVGKYLGTNAFAAVSSSGTLIMLLTSLFIGTAMGAGVAISKYFGADDYENVSRAIHTNLAIGIVSGAILTVIGVFLTPTFLIWMNTDAQVMPQAVEYFRYYFLGVLATVLYNMCTSILNALGDSRRPLHYLIVSSLINIALDLLFIGVFRWGVWSAAVATVLSQGTSCVLCLIHLLKKGEVYTVTPRNIRFHASMLSEILRYGLPSGVQNCVIGLANVIVQSQINSFGMLAMAAYGAHCKIEGFAFLPITSFTMACTTFVGQNLGARQYDRAKRGARFCILIAVIMAELIGLCYYLWASELITLFDSTPGVIALGVQQARTVSLFYCLLAFSHSIAAVCRGAGRAVVPMMIMLSVWCVIRIIYIMLVVHFIGEIEDGVVDDELFLIYLRGESGNLGAVGLHFQIIVFPEYILMPLYGLSCGVQVPVQYLARNLSCNAGGEANEVAVIFFHNLVRNPRLVVVLSLNMPGGYDLHQVLVAIVILCQEYEVVVVPVVVVLQSVVVMARHINLAAQYGFHSRMFVRKLHEFLDAVHIAVVGNGKRRHSELFCPVKEFGYG